MAQSWTQEFEEHRRRLYGIAYRMLGVSSDAEDAVQETWMRLRRSDPTTIDNLGAWLTTVVSRVCLNVLRTRRTKAEVTLDTHVPDPVIVDLNAADPEDEAILADSVGLALLVVLDTLSPAERVAFVLHDVFGVPFEEIAQLVDRTTEATRQLASRARRRVREGATPDENTGQQRKVVEAFFAASRAGDLDALVSVLHPDVVLRADWGTKRPAEIVHGAEPVAGRALTFSSLEATLTPALVNGTAGVVVSARGKPFSVMSFTVIASRIAAIDILVDPQRVAQVTFGTPQN